MVVWWLAPSPHSKRVPGSIPGWGLSVWSLLSSRCMREFSPASSHHLKTCMLGAPGKEKKTGWGKLFGLGWQIAYERENSDKKTNAEDGCTGPLARNSSTTQLRHGDERDNNIY